MIDHLRSVDERRLCGVIASISLDELASIDDGLRLFLGIATQH